MDRQIKAKDLEGNRSSTDVKRDNFDELSEKNKIIQKKNLEIDEIE